MPAPPQITLPEEFDASCHLRLSPEATEAVERGRLNVTIVKHGGKTPVGGIEIDIDARAGNIRMAMGGGGTSVSIGRVTGNYDLRFWRGSTLRIGDRTTCNGARFVCDNSDIVLGEDCMLSDQITVQSADQHAIVDIASGEIINTQRKRILIGDHVWLGRGSSALYGAEIGEGSILGFGAIANRPCPAHSLLAGVPARVIREGVTWSRSPVALDAYAQAAIGRAGAEETEWPETAARGL